MMIAPYRELELYLEKAQEEIGRAVKELEEHEENTVSNECLDCENSSTITKSSIALLHLPQSFPAKERREGRNSEIPNSCNGTLNLVNRVCHEGNILNFGYTNGRTNYSVKSPSSRRTFLSSFSSGITSRNTRTAYSPNTRRRLWKMHPSISFPETSKDLLLLGKEIKDSRDKRSLSGLVDSIDGNQTSINRKHRQRSNSETFAPLLKPCNSEDPCSFPRPPSGDMNLLSIWADNLVLELDKSLSGELMNSMESFSPSSDYSLSPIKRDDNLEAENNTFSPANIYIYQNNIESNILAGRSLKLISRSPDSGIEQTCNTPEMTEDCIDSLLKRKTESEFISNEDIDIIAPPPPEFKDDTQSLTIIGDRSRSTQTNKSFYKKSNYLKSAEIVTVIPEAEEALKCVRPVVEPQAVPTKTIDLEDSPVVHTMCAISKPPAVHDKPKSFKTLPLDRVPCRSHIRKPANGIPTFSSLPKCSKTISNEYNACETLQKESRNAYDTIFPQRSASQSALSTIDYVSFDELASMMRKIKSPREEVKEEKENKDAVTQTSPLPLSRSSSFTWVTECDCSDLDLQNVNGESDESLVVSGCSNCKAVCNNHDLSSSSLSISSDEDDARSASPASGNSSLYLSACSGSSDSFEEATVISDTPVAFLPPSCQLFLSSDMTLRGSVLGDISEEQTTSETISMQSNPSNPSIAESSTADAPEQSASFPCTLRFSRKKRSMDSPAQPIEPTVLIINDLSTKSVSAPVLLRQKRYASNSKTPESSSSDSSPTSCLRGIDSQSIKNQVPGRAHSTKELNELQALEACSWLRAAGFPQYAQMYEDNQFPIDISIVEKDHAFLHPDSIQSLFRRLNILNRCVKMKFIDHVQSKSLQAEESDDEEQYALSENWEFQRSSRRWSRIPSPPDDASESTSNATIVSAKPSDHLSVKLGRKFLNPEETYCSSHDSVFLDDQHSSPDSVRRSTILKHEKIYVSASLNVGEGSPGSSSGSGTLSLASEDMQDRRSLRRSGSDRVKEGAKALLRRMESLKGKRKKKTLDTNKQEKCSVSFNRTDGSSSSSLHSSPQFSRFQKLQVPPSDVQLPSNLRGSNISFIDRENIGAYSDSECSIFKSQEKISDSNHKQNNNQTSVKTTGPPDKLFPHQRKEKVWLSADDDLHERNLLHPISVNILKKEDGNHQRMSFYDNVCAPLVVFNDLFMDSLDENIDQDVSKAGSYTNQGFYHNQEENDIIVINKERRDSGVGSSLTREITYQQAPWHCFSLSCSSESKFLLHPLHITDLTVPQILLLRKLSLLKLTTVMEKFSPSSRTGWSWGMSKFIGRIRNPDYKDKVAFGVPLLLILQRTGQPLPIPIKAAMEYLRNAALDSTGIFRKSGVRSRIQKLKNLIETSSENISYEDQQAYDIADMLKQYFRELPEALLTNKLSETFISIFQHVPADLHLESIQATIMLLPDENREVLHSLLGLLYDVSQHSEINQMTATNIAVCFAPSLFHLSTPNSANSSPRRRKTVGVPDIKELNENRAAYECLSCMVSNFKTLFTIPAEVISQCRFSSVLHSQPATLENFSSFVYNGQSGWRGFVDNCIQLFLKEAKEKYKGWKTVCQTDHIEMSYRKLSDGHPLKLWKVSTEIEAPPIELLNRILRERHVWDNSFTKWKIVSRIDKNSEVFQYLTTSLYPLPPSDHCLLRSWRTDLTKGACVLVETSIEHPDAEVIPGSVRTLVLASRYLIEPCGSGKSRITYISRIDDRGRSPEWYNRAYGHICTLLLVKLRDSFSSSRAEGPETKV